MRAPRQETSSSLTSSRKLAEQAHHGVEVDVLKGERVPRQEISSRVRSAVRRGDELAEVMMKDQQQVANKAGAGVEVDVLHGESCGRSPVVTSCRAQAEQAHHGVEVDVPHWVRALRQETSNRIRDQQQETSRAGAPRRGGG